MPDGLYRDPLSTDEREAHERDLISFCDRELSLLGDIRGLNVLYAGGVSPLWLEGLSQRIGATGHLTSLDADAERIGRAREGLAEASLAAHVRLVVGDVFRPPFGAGAFDLVYSAGLFHELDVREGSAEDALAALISVTRPGGRVATSDFVDSVRSVQLEDEKLQRELARIISGARLYGIGPPERLVALHRSLLAGVRSRISPPYRIRHLGKLVVEEDDPPEPTARRGLKRLLERREALRERIRREGYTRPATLYVEGWVISD
jgi:SAM-dependent methyltransferase